MFATGKWHDRLIAFLLICLVQEVHKFGVSWLPRDADIGFVYFGSAALADFLTIVIAAHCLKGQLSNHIQWINWASMVTQAIGFLNYELAVTPPAAYNAVIGVLVYVQLVRFIWVDRNDVDYIGVSILRGNAFSRPKLHS